MRASARGDRVIERLDVFMARANAAYYAARDPYADFSTAPEISQVFGEILGIWAAQTWQALGRPSPVILAEAGPGRGTLMVDALRAIKQVAPEFAAALRVHLVEASDRLRALQTARLRDAVWHASVWELPDGPMLLLANEFVDALPIRQFRRRGPDWYERFVDGGRFVELPAQPPEYVSGLGSGDRIVEVGAEALAIAGCLGERLVRQQGAALLIDYGPADSGPGDSLQALRQGRAANPLVEPGSADLTAHVDFAAFAAAARSSGAAVHGPVPQGAFLTRLGLYPRIAQLARGRPAAEVAALFAAGRRLAEPEAMGMLFKVMAVCQRDMPVPAGFE
jgi:SAM-dependent MidA family methyltransferase